MRPLPTRARVDDPPSRRASTLATATVLTAALTATLLGAIPAVAADPAAAGKAQEQLSEAAAQTKAKGEAKKSGKPVEIVSKRTLTDDVWANPDGTLTANQAMQPVRVHRGGKLVDVDTTLAKQSNGRIAPGATAVGLSFSGGGTAPLVTMTKDGRDVSLTWPKALPAPKLQGNSATYAEILDGVDLRVSADVNGFSHQIVVKTRKAAENPALATLDFGLEGNGVTIRKEANGELRAVDPTGKTLFSAAKPQMWDSGAEKPVAPAAAAAAPAPKTASPKTASPKTASPKTSAPQTLSGTDVQAAPTAEAPVAQPPADPVPAVDGISNGAKEADLGVDLKGSKLTLTPDRKLLTAAETAYPVVIDPVWRDDWKSSWAIAYKHNAFANSANTNYWNGGTLSKEGRVGCAKDGQNGNAVVCAKTFFQVGMGAVAGKQILSSTFRIQQKYAGSHSCDSGQLEIWDTDAIGGGTTWNNQPAWKRKVASIGESYGGRNCPGNGDTVEMNVTSAVADAARWNWPAWTMGLKAAPETVDVSWRKFNPDSARISTQYNTLPVTPYDRGSDPSVPCTGGAPIGTTDQVVLRARVADNEDNSLSAEFHYWNANDYGTLKTARVPVASGNMAELRIPAAPLGSNTYRWDVRGNDGTADGPWAGQCLFTIDATKPGKLPGVSSVQFPENQPDNTAYARTEGTFTLNSGGEDDITKYQWWTESDPKVQEATPAAPGDPVAVKYTPTMAGPQVMYVRSLDAAGNRSDLKSYLFYAKRQPVRDKPGDLNQGHCVIGICPG